MITTASSVDVFVLNWNGRAFLDACLAALDAQSRPPRRVTLIDNGSTDGSLAHVRDRYPHIALIDNGRNLGFAAGNNAALRHDHADVVALVNPDVIPSASWLERLVAALEADPRVGVAGSKLWYPDRTTIQHAGGIITHPQAMPGHFGIGETDSGQHDDGRDPDYVIGGAIALRREALEAIGLLDEGFFLYFEDVDFCFRARRAGYRVAYVPEATAVHVESATAIKGSFSYLHRFHTGRWRFLLKHFDGDELLGETLAAETAWLERVSLEERLAAGLAYTTTIYGWDELLTARVRDGGSPLSTGTAAAILEGLRALEHKAWRRQRASPRAADIASLRATAVLSGRPFESDVPLFGPLIVAVRSAWNAVAGRETVDQLATQQSHFNVEAVDVMAAAEAGADDVLDLVALVERELSARSSRAERALTLAELRDRIKMANARLKAIEQRITRLEERSQG